MGRREPARPPLATSRERAEALCVPCRDPGGLSDQPVMETGGRALATPGDSPTKAEGNVVPAKAGAGAPETPAAVQVRAAFGPGGAAPSVGVTPPLPPSPALSLCVVPSPDAIEGARHSAGPPGRGAHSASGAARPAVRAALRASLLFGGKSKPEAPGALGADQPCKSPSRRVRRGPGSGPQ